MAAPPAVKPRSNLPKPRQPSRIARSPPTSTPTTANPQTAGSTTSTIGTRVPSRSRLPTSASTLPTSSIPAVRRRAPTPVFPKPNTAPPPEPPPTLFRAAPNKHAVARQPSQSSVKSSTSARSTTPGAEAHLATPASKATSRARADSHASSPSTPDARELGAGAYPTPPTSVSARSRFGRPATARAREDGKGEVSVQAAMSTPAVPFNPAAASTASKMSSPTTSPCSTTSGTTPALRDHKENRPPFAAAQAGLSSGSPSPGSPSPGVSPLPPHNATQAAPPLREASAGVLELPVFSPSLWTLSPDPLVPPMSTRPLAFRKAVRIGNTRVQASVEMAAVVPAIIQQLLDEVVRCIEEWRALFHSCEGEEDGSFALGMERVGSSEGGVSSRDYEVSFMLYGTPGQGAEAGGTVDADPLSKESPSREKRGWRDIPIARDARVSLPPVSALSPKVVRSVTIIHPRRATMVEQSKDTSPPLWTPPNTPPTHSTLAIGGPPRVPLPPVPQTPSYLSLLPEINLSPILVPPPLELLEAPRASEKSSIVSRRETAMFYAVTTPVVSSPLAQTPFTARTPSDQASTPMRTPSGRSMVTFTSQTPPRNRAESTARSAPLPPTPRSHQRPPESQPMASSPRPTSHTIVDSPSTGSRMSVGSVHSTTPSSLGTGNAKLGRSSSLMGFRSLFKRTSAAELGASASGGLLGGERARRKRAESLKGRISEPRVVSLGTLGVQFGEGARKREGLGLGVGVGVEMAVVEEGQDLESEGESGEGIGGGAEIVARGSGGRSLREQEGKTRRNANLLRKKTR
ncbi:hypothetical protein OF83DRAFT_1085911 [Amylostereum chailletii]|nr:hypothetical protein OF83DRAFT_1085911 [Amylostereum chailletii]